MLSMDAGEMRTSLFMYLVLSIALDLKLSVECVHPCSMIKESVFVRERCLVLFRLPLSWEDSKNYCEKNFYGGSISELLSDEERIKASGLLKTHGSSSAWLGLTDIETSGQYLWTYSRTTINDTFLMNNVTLLSHEGHCIQLLTNNTFTVNDCQSQGDFFCDIDFKGLQNVADSCYPWKSSVFKDGICYKSFNILLSPSEAKIQCQTFKATISETTGTVEYGVISQYIKDQNYTSGVWVGAYVDYDGFYKWNTTSTKLLYQWVDNFTQVNVSSRTQLSCVAMDPIEGLFYEVSCAIANYYLCERADPCWFLKESVYIRGRCLVLSNAMLTWTQAKSYCENNFHGGRLSELIFENERKTSSELIQHFRVKSSQAWIALTSQEYGTFQWTYSNTSISKYNNGQDYLVGNESCVAIVDVDTFNVTSCEKLSNVLCDIEVNGLEPITDPCYPWKNSVFDNGTCFILFTSLMPWDKAHTLCAEKGYKLVELTTDSSLTSAANFLKVQGQSAWVGAQSKNDPHSREFVWTSSNVSITVNWTDIVDTNTSDGCVLFDPVSGLYGEYCSSQHALVCEVAKTDPCKSIQSNYVYINGQCYFRRNDHLSWTEAQEACLKERSTLAYPSNTTDFTNKLLTMVKLNETVWFQDSNNKAVKWFNASSVPATSTDSETHAFICQTAAAALRQKDYIIAVPTALTASSSFKARLSITSRYSTITVYLNITSVCGAQMLYKYYSVGPFSSSTLHLEPLMISCNKYVSSRYAQVTSTQPVTIVLQVEDSASRLAGSTLVLPAAMFTSSGLARSYFVKNILKKLIDKSVALVMMPSKLDVAMLLDMSRTLETQDIVANVTYSLTRSYLNIFSTTRTGPNLCIFINNYSGQSYFYSNQAVSIYLMNRVVNFSSSELDNEVDVTFDQLLPLEYSGSQYISFPCPGISSLLGNITFRLISLLDNNDIYIIGSSGLVRQVFPLKNVGEVRELDLPSSNFYFFSSSKNKSFYISLTIRVSVGGSFTPDNVCETSLIPVQLWRYHYVVDIGTRRPLLNIFLFVIVETSLRESIEINSIKRVSECTDIPGTNWTGCVYNLTSDVESLYHVQLKYHQRNLAAYMLTYDNFTMACTALGAADDVEQFHSFSDSSYLRSLNALPSEAISPDTCTLPTTTVAPSTTTATSQSSTVVYMNVCNTSLWNDSTMPSQNLSSSTTSQDTTSMSSEITSEDTPRNNIVTTTTRKQDISQYLKGIVQNLTVDKESTSAFRRTKECVPDYRPSSNAVGATGIALLTFVFGFICGNDVVILVIAVIKWLKMKISLNLRNIPS